MTDDGKVYIKDSGGTYREIYFNRLVHERSLGKQFDSLRVQTKNYEYSSGTWLYEMLGANRDIKFEVDGTKYFEGKILSRGSIGVDGSLTINAVGKGADVADAKVTISLSSTTNVGVMTQALSGTGYTLNTVGSTSSITSYEFADVRGKVFREMQDNYGWALYFEADGNCYYEPLGYYSSGETINTSTDNARIIKWEKDIIRGVVVNSVEVAGTNAGTKYSGTATDATSISAHGERFKRIIADYLSSDGEASAIATANLQPNAGEGGQIEVYWYVDNLVNETIEIIDDSRDINDDFIVVKQVNYFPERKSILHVGYIREEGHVLTHQNELDLRKERQRLLTNTTVDVGGQNLDGTTEDNDVSISGSVSDDNAVITGSVSSDDANITGGVQGVVTELGYNSSQYEDSVISDVDTNSWTNVDNSYSTSSSYDYLFHAVFLSFYIRALEVSVGYDDYPIYVRLYNSTDGSYFPSSSGIQLLSEVYYQEDDIGISMMEQLSISTLLFAPYNWKNKTLVLQYKMDSDESKGTTQSARLFYQYFGSRGHTHNDNIDDSGHDHNDTFADSGHDHGDNFSGNDHDHDLDTQTTDSKNVNVVVEEKIDR